VPAADLSLPARIAAFVEKPERSRAAALMEQGALRSSFLFTCGVRTLLACYRRALPELLQALESALSDRSAPGGAELRRLYAAIPAHDFSRDILQACVGEARVLPVPACGWTDLGTPERVAECPGLAGPLVQRARERKAAREREELSVG